MKQIKWESIIDADFAKERLSLIVNVLDNSSDKNYSLLTGNTGIAIFYYYYWLSRKSNKYLEQANNLITSSFNNLNNQSSFCNGNAGFMWAVNHLINTKFIKANSNELFSEFEPSLFQKMIIDLKVGKYDFMHNALGIGLYFLNTENKHSQTYNELLILELENIAEKDNNGLKWRSFVQQEKESIEVYNLSMSHGIASIISILSKAYKKNILKDKTKYLLNGAVSYLLACKSNISSSNGSFFPSYVYLNEKNNNINSRLAWCYGDLGIGMALWQASQVLNNIEWEKIAIETLLQTTSRKNSQKEFVIDAGICHGSAGIAHIYNRMYQNTGNINFKNSALYWLQETINKANFSDGLAGYKVWRSVDDEKWTTDRGLLEGISGIGLVLLSAMGNIEPKWDECLLLS